MNETKMTVGLIFGGPSGEHEISCISAASIAKNIDREKYDVIAIGIDRDGRWFAPIPFNDIKTFKAENYLENEVYIKPKKDNGKLYSNKNNSLVSKIDVVFEIIHGTYGEDGKLQGLLDICGLPYVGSGVVGSAVGMDKIICRQIVNSEGVAQVKYVSALRHEWENEPEAVIAGIESELNYPVFVKPANMGSSVGISKADDRESLKEAINEAARFDSRLMIEEGIEMREIEISVMGNNDLFVSLPGEILSAQAFYDYETKYHNTESKTQVPANLDEDTIANLQMIAKKVYKALDLAGLSRVDFFIEKNTNQIYFNEVNTLPGFTDISMYAQMWQASGIEMGMLIEELINLAFKRRSDLNRNEIQA